MCSTKITKGIRRQRDTGAYAAAKRDGRTLDCQPQLLGTSWMATVTGDLHFIRASLHNWLQYFSSEVTTHLHERCAHFFCSSFAMIFSFLPEVFLEADTG